LTTGYARVIFSAWQNPSGNSVIGYADFAFAELTTSRSVARATVDARATSALRPLGRTCPLTRKEFCLAQKSALDWRDRRPHRVRRSARSLVREPRPREDL